MDMSCDVDCEDVASTREEEVSAALPCFLC